MLEGHALSGLYFWLGGVSFLIFLFFSQATFDATGAVDFLDVFNQSGDDFDSLTVAAGELLCMSTGDYHFSDDSTLHGPSS